MTGARRYIRTFISTKASRRTVTPDCRRVATSAIHAEWKTDGFALAPGVRSWRSLGSGVLEGELPVRSHADELSHETGAQEPLRAIVAIGVRENADEGDHGRHARQT